MFPDSAQCQSSLPVCLTHVLHPLPTHPTVCYVNNSSVLCWINHGELFCTMSLLSTAATCASPGTFLLTQHSLHLQLLHPGWWHAVSVVPVCFGNPQAGPWSFWRRAARGSHSTCCSHPWDRGIPPPPSCWHSLQQSNLIFDLWIDGKKGWQQWEDGIAIC